jgi:hypothetical protein
MGEATTLRDELRGVGMDAQADEIDAQLRDAEKAFTTVKPYIPLIGNPQVAGMISDFETKLIKTNSDYQKTVKNQLDAQKSAAEAQAKADKQAEDQAKTDAAKLQRDQQLADQSTKRAQDLTDAEQKRQQQLQDAQTQRSQDQTDLKDKRSYDAQQQADQRAYAEQQASAQAQADQNAADTATQDSGGSSLGFGLLGAGGGSTEFVNKDKAAQVYFKKSYDELTPEQKALLNLLKGGN